MGVVSVNSINKLSVKSINGVSSLVPDVVKVSGAEWVFPATVALVQTTTPGESYESFANTGRSPVNFFWGDGDAESASGAAVTHTYPDSGLYTLQIEGEPQFRTNTGTIDTATIAIVDWGAATTMLLSFMSNLTSIPSTAPTNLNGDLGWRANGFDGCQSFNDPNIVNYTSLNVEATLLNCFRDCTVFNQDISAIDTSGVGNFSSMFRGASAFDQDISGWDTSSCLNFGSMFRDASSFNQDISGWNTSLATSLSNMFYGALSFDQNLGSWELNSLISCNNMFEDTNMSDSNIQSVLVGWNNNSNTNTGVNAARLFGVKSLSQSAYPSAKAAYDNLVLSVGSGGKGWTITDLTWAP